MAQAGGSRTVSNDVSAVTPEIWSDILQIPLYKTLVVMETCNMDIKDELTFGDTLKKQYFDSLSAQTYIPGVSFTAQAQDYHTDTLIVDNYKTVAIYVDDIEELQSNVNLRTSMQEEIAFQLRDVIDTNALQNMVSGDVRDGAEMVQGGVADHGVSATTANIIDIYSKARMNLRKNNVAEMGDWISIVSPNMANLVEFKATSVGFNVADATLRNGYAGDFMGFRIYVSNNVPTGTDLSGETAFGGADGATAQIPGNYEIAYFGKKGAIDVALQKAPSVQITKVPDMHGYYISAYTVYGSTTFTKNASRFLSVGIIGLN